MKITYREKIDFNLKSRKNDDIKGELLSNLKILPGIGYKKEEKLKTKSYGTLYDLLNHDSYSSNAQKAIDKIEHECFIREYNLFNELSKYSNSSNNLGLKSQNNLDPFNLKFMDIETWGLSNVPVILTCVAEIKGNHMESSQYLMRDRIKERAII